MNDFFKQTNLKGSAIGNHEFDFGPSFLFNYLAGRQSPNLAANIKSETGQSDFMPYQEG
jgi:2',3'-cyclic-nucleotide 2'-phosphodiesterase (5'-nucleotidase family)